MGTSSGRAVFSASRTLSNPAGPVPEAQAPGHGGVADVVRVGRREQQGLAALQQKNLAAATKFLGEAALLMPCALLHLPGLPQPPLRKLREPSHSRLQCLLDAARR